MKTSELIGALLDYWVARADPAREDMRWEQHGPDRIGFSRIGSSPEFACWIVTDASTLHARATLRDSFPSAIFYAPSSDWSRAGPIVECERMKVEPLRDGSWDAYARNSANEIVGAIGPTPLVAVMRAYVTSKFGAEVPDTQSNKDTGGTV